jgi:hypothetical protein
VAHCFWEINQQDFKNFRNIAAATEAHSHFLKSANDNSGMSDTMQLPVPPAATPHFQALVDLRWLTQKEIMNGVRCLNLK